MPRHRRWCPSAIRFCYIVEDGRPVAGPPVDYLAGLWLSGRGSGREEFQQGAVISDRGTKTDFDGFRRACREIFIRLRWGCSARLSPPAWNHRAGCPDPRSCALSSRRRIALIARHFGPPDQSYTPAMERRREPRLRRFGILRAELAVAFEKFEKTVARTAATRLGLLRCSFTRRRIHRARGGIAPARYVPGFKNIDLRAVMVAFPSLWSVIDGSPPGEYRWTAISSPATAA